MAKKVAESKAGKYQDLDTWNKKGQLKEGDAIEGYFVDSEEFTTKHGDMIVYIIAIEKNLLVKVVGQTDIRSKFDSIPMGSHVWLEFKGLTETKNGAMKTYEISYDDEDIKELKDFYNA